MITQINLYDLNANSPTFFKKISNIKVDIENTDVIEYGDFNCVINPECDYYNYRSINNAKARDEVLNLMNEKYLIDPFGENFLSNNKNTWKRKLHANKQDKTSSVSENLSQFVKNQIFIQVIE